VVFIDHHNIGSRKALFGRVIAEFALPQDAQAATSATPNRLPMILLDHAHDWPSQSVLLNKTSWPPSCNQFNPPSKSIPTQRLPSRA